MVSVQVCVSAYACVCVCVCARMHMRGQVHEVTFFKDRQSSLFPLWHKVGKFEGFVLLQCSLNY